MSAEDIACHILGRRHVLDRTTRKNLPNQFCMRHFVQKTVCCLRIDFKGMPQSNLAGLHAAKQGKLLVDKIGCSTVWALVNGIRRK